MTRAAATIFTAGHLVEYNVYPMQSMETRLARGGVLAAALGVFERKGFGAARVEDILEAAGIARRTFYRQFKGKDDVLAALYGVAMTEIIAAMQSVRDDEDPLRGVHAAIDVYLDYHVDNAATLRVLLGQAVRTDSPLYTMRRTFRAALVKLMTDVARGRRRSSTHSSSSRSSPRSKASHSKCSRRARNAATSESLAAPHTRSSTRSSRRAARSPEVTESSPWRFRRSSGRGVWLRRVSFWLRRCA